MILLPEVAQSASDVLQLSAAAFCVCNEPENSKKIAVYCQINNSVKVYKIASTWTTM